MPQVDYSRLSRPKQRSTTGHSVKNSFYLQKSKEIPGWYKAYYEYDTSGMRVTVIGDDEGSDQEDSGKITT